MPSHRRGFTLLELIVTVTVLGIVTTVAAARIPDLWWDSRIKAVTYDLTVIERAAIQYYGIHSQWPDDSRHREFPVDLSGFIDERLFLQPTPVGGYYDWNKDYIVTAGMSIWDSQRPLSTWIEIDAARDDGNLNTGKGRRSGNHWCFRLE